MDADTWERDRTTFSGLEWRRELAQFPKLAVPSVAFRNNGDLTFSDVGQRRGVGADDAISDGMAMADLDGERASDIRVNRHSATPAEFDKLHSTPRGLLRVRRQVAYLRCVG